VTACRTMLGRAPGPGECPARSAKRRPLPLVPRTAGMLTGATAEPPSRSEMLPRGQTWQRFPKAFPGRRSSSTPLFLEESPTVCSSSDPGRRLQRFFRNTSPVGSREEHVLYWRSRWIAKVNQVPRISPEIHTGFLVKPGCFRRNPLGEHF